MRNATHRPARWALLVLALSIAMTVGALVQRANAQGFPRIMDMDQDGTINFSEFMGPPEMFGRLDRDGDGFITEQEFERGASQKKARRTAAPDRATAPAPAPPDRNRPPGSKPAFMTEAEIRAEIIGNTAKFVAPNSGRPVRVHFATDGTAAVAAGDNGARIVTRPWQLSSDGTLCRTLGQGNKQHCTRIRRGRKDDIFLFVLKNNRYRVKLLEGRKLRGPASANR